MSNLLLAAVRSQAKHPPPNYEGSGEGPLQNNYHLHRVLCVDLGNVCAGMMKLRGQEGWKTLRNRPFCAVSATASCSRGTWHNRDDIGLGRGCGALICFQLFDTHLLAQLQAAAWLSRHLLCVVKQRQRLASLQHVAQHEAFTERMQASCRLDVKRPFFLGLHPPHSTESELEQAHGILLERATAARKAISLPPCFST